MLCLFYLSFTWVSYHIDQKAIQRATNTQGHVDFKKKQEDLHRLWEKPVYNFLGLKNYTYEQVKERELMLGLDLQGGMHVTLEISPVEIIQSLAGFNQDPAFLAALAQARNNQDSSRHFLQKFYRAYQVLAPNQPLHTVFANTSNRHKIDFNTDDKTILAFLAQAIEQAIDRSFQILRARLDRFGTTQPNIQKLPHTGRIQIELPGINNPARVRKLLQGVAKLEFCVVHDIVTIKDTLERMNTVLLSNQKKETTDTIGQKDDNISAKETTAEASSLFTLLQSPYALTYRTSDIKKIQNILEQPAIQKVIPTHLQFLWDIKPQIIPGGDSLKTLYPIKKNYQGRALLSGDVITEASQTFDEQGKPAVSMQMNSLGTKAWKKITAQHIGKQVAIVLDDYVYSAPVINTVIPNGNSQISGNFTFEEAQDLANILKTGSLPAPVHIVEEAMIGPTLGKEAQKQGIFSMVMGLLAVILFMMMYYAKGGLIANIALLFNILFILGILTQFHASLTLPGIAGIVLTIGMSIDANVLIFERIREELRKGLSIVSAIAEGYKKAYSAIIDANVTTFFTGAVLYFLGQGPVRGFATTLMIGIVTSFFTAVFLTRLLIIFLDNKKNTIQKLTFSFGYSKNLLHNFRIDFLGKRKIVYGISSILIVLGLGLMVKQQGLNLGVDFTGGRSFVVAFDQPVQASTLKVALSKIFEGKGTEVKSYGANNMMKITTSYQMEDGSTQGDIHVKNSLIRGITAATQYQYQEEGGAGDTFRIVSTQKIGASIAHDITTASKKSVILSLVIIFLYILLRFRKWQFGLSAVIALLHDSLMVFSAFAIMRFCGVVYEVDQVFIAAILTVIGYSINDTVVVFDRIREKWRTNTHKNFQVIANESINETLSRTLITSITTLLVVLILYFFGGEALSGFSFALLVGIIFGTYSSICIATPLVLDLSARLRLSQPHLPKVKKKNIVKLS